MLVLPVCLQDKSMDSSNSQDCIKYDTDVKREEGEILIEEGEIFFSTVQTSDNIQKNIQKQRSVFTYEKNKVKTKILKKPIFKPEKKLNHKDIDSLMSNTYLESTDSCNECKQSQFCLRHTRENMFDCAQCKKSFTCVSSLNIHKLIHKGEKPHVCILCHKRFYTLSDLKKHTFSHSGEKYACNQCEKAFSRPRNLKKHKLFHNI